ncbi:MAG: hypothetical protein WAW85_11965 [Gordonia sp. (in: high G+C Gram-positive bacteria)]
MLSLANEAAFLLAADPPPKGPEFGKSSPIGLLVIVLLLVSTFLLIRSMNKQLRKLPETFDVDHPEPDQAFDEGTDVVQTDVVEPDETVEEPVNQPADESGAGR